MNFSDATDEEAAQKKKEEKAPYSIVIFPHEHCKYTHIYI